MPRPNRKTTRLQTHDYSTPGAYFMTAVTHNRARLFSTIRDGIATPTCWGAIVLEEWNALPARFPVRLDEIAVMPDHVHYVVWLTGKDPFADPAYFAETDRRRQRQVMLLFKVMSYWKSNVTKRMRAEGFKGEVWQGRDYDRIVRDEEALRAIRRYVRNNPMAWSMKYESNDRNR